MTVFADSSAVVKRYADEPGAEIVRELPLLVVSTLARVEVTAALWRKVRTGQLAEADAALLAEVFTAEWHTDLFVAVDAGVGIVDDATSVVARHGLRAYDGMQLASALAARRADPDVDTIACFDVELASAAAREGFRLLGP